MLGYHTNHTITLGKSLLSGHFAFSIGKLNKAKNSSYSSAVTHKSVTGKPGCLLVNYYYYLVAAAARGGVSAH